ncbi:hypothetical protein MMJ09_21380, partial [Bacillus vallismortis]|nr:hypothetical protein [Bacillus vallismortis]
MVIRYRKDAEVRALKGVYHQVY